MFVTPREDGGYMVSESGTGPLYVKVEGEWKMIGDATRRIEITPIKAAKLESKVEEYRAIHED